MSSHTVYAVTVVKLIGEREIDSWVVYRRYSDFYDFHFRLEEKVSIDLNYVSRISGIKSCNFFTHSV